MQTKKISSGPRCARFSCRRSHIYIYFFLFFKIFFNVRGPSKKLITDHENSESSERDRLRQRFSLSCHPSLPLLVCSDGYHFTLMEIAPEQSLSASVSSLLSEARTYLDLDAKGCSPSGEEERVEDDCRGFSDSSGLDFRELASSLGSEEDFSKCKGFSPRRHSEHSAWQKKRKQSGEGFLDKYLKNLETGRIEFASEGTRGDVPTSGAGQIQRRDNTLQQALLQLQSVAGLLLTCDPFVPCRGAWPSALSPTHSQAEECKGELARLSSVFLSTVSNVLSQASFLSAFSNFSTPSEMLVLTLDFTRALLKLLGQDTFVKANSQLSLSTANVILSGFLSGWFKRHLDFKGMDQGLLTVTSVLEYADVIGKGMLDFSSLLEDVILVLLSTYDVYPSIIQVSPAPSGTSQLSSSTHLPLQPSSNCILYLSSSLNMAHKLISLLWKDMVLCRSLSATAGYLPGDRSHQAPQLSRKTMSQNISNSTKNACGTLRALQAYIRNLLAQFGGEGQLSLADCRTSKATNKPLTYLYEKEGDKVGKLLDYLVNYDVLAAVELANSCMESISDGTVVSKSRGLFELPPQADEDWASEEAGVWTRSGDFNVRLLKVASDADKELLGIFGQFMAAYFTNKKLTLSRRCDQPGSSSSQTRELSRARVTESLRQDSAGEIWMMEKTLGCLLLAGKWEEACEFVLAVEDWRKGFVLASAHSLYNKVTSRDTLDVSLVGKSHQLGLVNTLKILATVHRKFSVDKFRKVYHNTSIGSPGASLLKNGESYLRETFRMFATMKMEAVIVSACGCCLSDLAEECFNLGVKVAPGYQLPAPPLYCVQPAITKEVRCALEKCTCPQFKTARVITVALSSVIKLLRNFFNWHFRMYKYR